DPSSNLGRGVWGEWKYLVENIEEIKRIIKEKGIKGIDETFEEISNVAKNNENFKENINKIFLARGNVIELSTIIEVSFNELLFQIDKEKYDKKDRFMSKAKRVEELMLEYPEKMNIKREQFKMFQEFVTLRNIFAHVPINWFSEKLEFEVTNYEPWFKDHLEWKNASIAIKYFIEIGSQTIELIKSFVKVFLTQKTMEREINKAVFGVETLPEDVKKIMEEVNKDDFNLNFGPGSSGVD
ncbi:MAG: hypothetical protein Q8Q04_01750, partial [archaeon]|nr:hypothetical protein [archaeon]